MTTIFLIAEPDRFTPGFGEKTLKLAPTDDPEGLDLAGVGRVVLEFPRFTDGRAYSQAWLLRRRLRFAGDLRASGDVRVDHVLQMRRCGFSSAELAPGEDPALALRLLDAFSGFYQRDALLSLDLRPPALRVSEAA